MWTRVATPLLLLSGMLVGCESSNSPPPVVVVHHDNLKETASPAPGLASDRETRRGGRLYYEDRVPSTAAQVGQPSWITDGARRDAGLVAQPAENGTVWLVDAPTGRILYSAHSQRGQRLLVDLDRGDVALDRMPVHTQPLEPRGDYRIYFLPD